jgi:hypothetical protein
MQIERESGGSCSVKLGERERGAAPLDQPANVSIPSSVGKKNHVHSHVHHAQDQEFPSSAPSSYPPVVFPGPQHSCESLYTTACQLQSALPPRSKRSEVSASSVE